VAKWKSTLVASWLAQICSIMGFAIVIPFLPFYVRELGVTDEKAVLLWSGWGLSTSVGLTMALVSPLWGLLADRHGRKMMVMRSMFGGVLVLGLMGLVQNVYQLLALRILQGVLTGTVTAPRSPSSAALFRPAARDSRSG
jgi:MFS transporter, DHA1 family, multidrug resistance protein